MAKDAPPEWGAKILHASLSVGDAVLAGGDTQGYERPRGFSVLLGLSEPVDAERIYHALAEDGTVTVPLHETFWALRYPYPGRDQLWNGRVTWLPGRG